MYCESTLLNFEQPNPKTLIINGHTVEFEQRIMTLIPLEDRVIVHLNTSDFEFGDKLVGRNLLAYGPDGNQLGRVSNHGATLGASRRDTVTLPDKTGRRRVPQSIFDASLSEEDGVIRAGIADSVLSIDPENGKIIDMEYMR